jgi:chromosome segregation ATPase
LVWKPSRASSRREFFKGERAMSHRNWLLAATLLGAMALPASVSFAQSTDNGGGSGGATSSGSSSGGSSSPDANRGNRGNRGNFDPAQFRQRMEDRMKEQLGVNDDEWKVIQPKLQKVMEAQRDARGGGFGFRGGRDRGSSSRQQTPVQQAQHDLQQLLENKEAPAAEIQAKLTALREAREKAKTELASAQKDLKDVLTQRQEAVLVMMGMLD